MQNQETIKSAAKRMCELLGAEGVKVKHTRMLEALAAGFGLDSWRELKAVIDAPRGEPAKPKLPKLGVEQMWTVHAVYTDNNQQYGDYFSGRTPLEAAINAIVERRTDCGLEIQIEEVLDANDKCQLSPSFLTDIELSRNDVVLRALMRCVLAIPASHQWAGDQAAARDWLYSVLDGQLEEPQQVSVFTAVKDTLGELSDWDAYDEVDHRAVGVPIFEGATLVPTKALELLCDAVEGNLGGVVKLEAKDEDLAKKLYQVRALCGYFAGVLDSSSHGIADIELRPFQPQLVA